MTKDWEEALNAGYVHTPAVSVIYGYMYNADLNINHGRADKPSLRAYNCFNRVFQDILSKQDKNGYVPIDVADSAVHVLNSYIDNEYLDGTDIENKTLENILERLDKAASFQALLLAQQNTFD